MRRLRRCTPRLRSPSYDLRRAPRIHPHFDATQSAGGPLRGPYNRRRLPRLRQSPLVIPPMSDQSTLRYAAEDLRVFARALIERAGVRADIARDLGAVLLDGVLLGHTTHG